MANHPLNQHISGIFLDVASVDRGDLDLQGLKSILSHWDLYPATRSDEVQDRVRAATVVISNKAPLSRQALEGASNLQLLCVAATGVNNVDLSAAQEQGITVCNARGYATPAVVQHVFALVLALATRLLDQHQAVQAGAWSRSEQFCLLDLRIRELAGKTLAIIGYGELGQAVALVANAFGMSVVVAERRHRPPRRGRIAFEDALEQADIVTLHCPLTPDTQGLIGAGELAQMKPDALLINTARGGIVDEVALAQALGKGIIGGAGVDVLTVEPPAMGNPLLSHSIPNLIVTPHTAWASREARQRLVDQTAQNIRAYLLGKPQNVVV